VYAVYSGLLALALVLALPYYLWRDRLDGRYRRSFRERLGHLPEGLRSEAPSIWVHAVSVGEVLAAASLLGALRERFPGRPLFLSTTTATGHAVARDRVGGLDGLFYAPFDWPGPVRRVLERLRPALLVLVDTELWPNTIRESRRAGARVALVNGRISERSFPRYRSLRPLLRRVLSQVDVFLMQADLYARRVVAIGAPASRVRVVGSLKFEAAEPAAPAPELAARLAGPRPLWIAGSTMPGEEESVLEAFRRVREAVPGAGLLLAPRHPERAPAVEELVRRAGFECLRRSRLEPGQWRSSEQVVLLDTLGELASLGTLAAAVFVGGSLVPKGGHNVLEAAAASRPVIVGPHMENFQQIAEVFREAGAWVEVRDAAALAEAAIRLLSEPAWREELGGRGRALVERHRGALGRTLDALGELLA
jgi:3-deoxy-D-manno-octulosonic-acid transferase